MFKRIFLFSIFLLLFSQTVWSQAMYNVSGWLYDSATQERLPYAAVLLLDKESGDIIVGSATDAEGKFNIEVKAGTYDFKVQFLSYKDHQQSITVNNNLNLNGISMSASEEMLSELELTAEKNQMQLKIDKREFNVGKDLTNKGGNASQILDNIPSVEVDIDGGVSLRGSQNVRVLIDGKPSSLLGLSSTNALDMIPAETIEKVEIITNPSARYDAGGEVGIINIILKKDKVKGINGVINARLGDPLSYGGGFNLNIRQKKFNIFTGLSHDYRSNKGSGDMEQYFTNSDAYFKTEHTDDRTGKSNVFRLGTDYYINKKNVLTLSTVYTKGSGEDETNREYWDYDSTSVLSNYVVRDLKDSETSSGHDISLNFTRDGKKEGQKLTFDAQYSSRKEEEGGPIQELNTNSNFNDKYQRVANDEKAKNILLQLDYTLPLKGKSKVEAGLKMTGQDMDVDYIVEQRLNDELDWNILGDFYNSLNYDEKIYAAYFMYANEVGKISYQVGLRNEYSNVKSTFHLTDEKYERTYNGIFPTAHISYKKDETSSYQLSFSKRINRPRRWHLMPFFSFSNERTFFTGNPELNPSYTYSYEASKLNFWDKGSFLASVYYRHSTDIIDRLFLSVDVDENRAMIKPFNIGTSNDYGVELTGSYKPTKKLKLRANCNIFRQVIDAEFIQTTGDVTRVLNLDTDAYSWNARLSANYILPKDIVFQTSFNYRAATQDTQGEVEPRYAWDMGFSKDILKGKGTFSLSVRDILNSRRRRATSVTPDFVSNYNFQWNSRTIRANFSYRINQKKSNKPNRGQFGGDGGGMM